jgi:hypothetical protein
MKDYVKRRYQLIESYRGCESNGLKFGLRLEEWCRLLISWLPPSPSWSIEEAGVGLVPVPKSAAMAPCLIVVDGGGRSCVLVLASASCTLGLPSSMRVAAPSPLFLQLPRRSPSNMLSKPNWRLPSLVIKLSGGVDWVLEGAGMVA